LTSEWGTRLALATSRKEKHSERPKTFILTVAICEKKIGCLKEGIVMEARGRGEKAA
jgi:hypothetical protein